MNGDQLIILEPNGVKRTKPITPQGLTIGRGNDNDLAITYANVSRNHALIAFDGGRYYVTDLNSANGTYLGNERLEPNTPTLWMAGRSLRIGPVSITLEQTAGATYQQVEARGEIVPKTEMEIRAEARTKTEMETMTGFRRDEAERQAGKEERRNLSWIFIVLALILLLAVLGVAAYFFLLHPG
jgi:pSer/pThr/pTyr-binding forkhead associated (FHA) protein